MHHLKKVNDIPLTHAMLPRAASPGASLPAAAPASEQPADTLDTARGVLFPNEILGEIWKHILLPPPAPRRSCLGEHEALRRVSQRFKDMSNQRWPVIESRILDGAIENFMRTPSHQFSDVDQIHLNAILARTKTLYLDKIPFGTDADKQSKLIDLLSRAPNIEKLSLENCRLNDVALRKIFDVVRIGGLKSLTELRLNDNRLTMLPEQLFDLTALTGLWLAGNQITVLPERIGDLAALTDLNLMYNRLTTLPERLFDLPALTKLYLTRNHLSVLSGRIGDLATLTELWLTGNQLASVPEQIGDLKALRELGLGSNQLTTLPERMAELKALKELWLGGNQLTTLPEWLGHLAALRVLSIRKNPLGPIPQWILDMKMPPRNLMVQTDIPL